MNWGVLIFGIFIAGLSALLYQSGGPGKEPGLLIAIAVLVAMDLGIYMGERRQRKRLARLGEALDHGTARLRVGLFTRRHIEGQFRGRAARLMFTPGVRGQPEDVIAQLACSSTFRFKFWKAARIRVGKARNSFQVNDAELDREFSFVSEDRDRARTWFLTPDINGKVVAMLRRGLGGTSLEWKKGFLACDICGFDIVREGQDLRRALESVPTDGHFGHRIPRSAISENAQEQNAIRGVLDSLTQLAASLDKGD